MTSPRDAGDTGWRFTEHDGRSDSDQGILPDSLNITDAAGRYVLINRQLADYYGISETEWLGKLPGDIAPRETADYQVEREIEFVTTTGKPVIDTETRFMNGDIEEYWLTNRQPIHDAASQVSHVLTVARDVTAVKHAEIDLLAAKEQAEYANRTKTEFLTNMSHELRTPLNAIIGFSDMMASEIFGPIEVPQYRENVGTISESGNHLLKLINDILDISKNEASSVVLNDDDVYLCTVINAAIA